jgi:hypothetical protein
MASRGRVRLRDLPSTGPEPRAQRRIGSEPVHGRGERGGVVRGNHDRAVAVAQERGRAAGGDADDRRAACHRLQWRQAERL